MARQKTDRLERLGEKLEETEETEWCGALTPPLTRRPSLVTIREGRLLWGAAPFSRAQARWVLLSGQDRAGDESGLLGSFLEDRR